MGFYNLDKIREDALKIVRGNIPLHELEINGEKQDDDEDTDYTGDTGEDTDDTEDGEAGEVDYTAPEEGDTDGTRGEDGGPSDTGSPAGDGGETPDDNRGDEGSVGGTEGDNGGGESPEMGTEDAPEEADYTIPDDASPEASEAAPQDTGTADDVETDYTADDGGDDTGGETDYTTDDGGAEVADTATGADGVPASDTGSEQDATADTDYTQDDGGDAEGGADAGSEETPAGDDSGGSAINDELKTAEDQLMADLSDEQKQIQSDELRKNFLELYNTVLDVIDKVNNIHKEESTLQVFEFISTQLLILKDIINTNITRSFDTKTYIENNIDYQHCLAILNSVKMMIDETNKKVQKAKEE